MKKYVPLEVIGTTGAIFNWRGKVIVFAKITGDAELRFNEDIVNSKASLLSSFWK